MMTVLSDVGSCMQLPCCRIDLVMISQETLHRKMNVTHVMHLELNQLREKNCDSSSIHVLPCTYDTTVRAAYCSTTAVYSS